MNILFVSALSGDLSVGPSYSVPSQIKAQSKIDNVLWINITDSFRDEWKRMDITYLSGSEYKYIRLNEISEKYFLPDIVLFEGCYNYPFMKLVKDIRKKGIPYILVPRSQLTAGAQKNKSIKKQIGNLIYFNGFIKNAAGIQYLTAQEADDSKMWGDRGFVIPNGINPIEYRDFAESSHDGLNIVYIGRVEIYQKGLDLLIEACSELKEEFQKKDVRVTLYGRPNSEDYEKLQTMIHENHLDNYVSIKPPVFGKDKYQILESSDIFIMTSRFEGLPMGLIEALAFGCASVVTFGTNMAEEISKYDAGWTCPEEPDAIADTLKKAIMEFSATGKLKSANAIKLSRNYRWEDIAVQTHTVCKNLLEKQSVMGIN